MRFQLLCVVFLSAFLGAACGAANPTPGLPSAGANTVEAPASAVPAATMFAATLTPASAAAAPTVAATFAPAGTTAFAPANHTTVTPAGVPASAPTFAATPAAAGAATGVATGAPAATWSVGAMRAYRLPAGQGPHDVAPAADGTVWYTAQAAGELGRLDPRTGQAERIPLGPGSAPHGVIVGPDGAAWVTDGGLNAILRVDPATRAVRRFPLPAEKRANLNTATFDRRGTLWFTGQNGYYGRVDPATGRVDVFEAPGGTGPYGITTTPGGDVYYASLAGSHIARIDLATGQATVIRPPTEGQGARRIWSDSRERLWVSEWNAGQLGMYDPASGGWREWKLPGPQPRPYAVYVDDRNMVWLSDWGANALVRFDPATEQFAAYPLPSAGGSVRQLLGRPGEVWGAESAADALVVVATR